MIKIVAISDTHCRLRKIQIPEGDLLLHAGDLTFRGDIQEISQELRELGRIAKNFKYGCVLTAGNHDWISERNPFLMEQMCKDEGLTYLCNSGIEINGFKIWGSPITPFFYNWAWNRQRGKEIKKYWDMIPNDTQILLTHGPAMGILDHVESFDPQKGSFLKSVGCWDLYERIQQLKDLKLHTFGHLHFSHGQTKIKDTYFVNASICTEDYKPINPPIIVEL